MVLFTEECDSFVIKSIFSDNNRSLAFDGSVQNVQTMTFVAFVIMETSIISDIGFIESPQLEVNGKYTVIISMKSFSSLITLGCFWNPDENLKRFQSEEFFLVPESFVASIGSGKIKTEAMVEGERSPRFKIGRRPVRGQPLMLYGIRELRIYIEWDLKVKPT